jgi:hypothetical protein
MLPNSQASAISPVVFARHHGLRPCDEGGEESIEFFEVHRFASLAALEEGSEAVKFGVGQRVVLGEGSVLAAIRKNRQAEGGEE